MTSTNGKVTAGERAIIGVLLLVYSILFPLFLIGWPCLIRLRRTARFYMTTSRDAVFGITARSPRHWALADHLVQTVGKGQGAQLRSQLTPALVHIADDQGIVLTGTAATRAIAAVYQREIPGLQIVGKGPLGKGLKLKREPARTS